VYFWLYEEDARHLIEALETYLTDGNRVLVRTDVRASQRDLHRRLDRIQDILDRLRAQFVDTSAPRPID
jgi:hypothetical protein